MHLACAHCCAKWKSLEQTPHTNKYEFLSKRHVILICLKTKNCYCYARARVCVADAIEVYYKIFALFRIHLIYACVLLLEFAHTFYSQRLARDLCRSSSFSCRGIANFFSSIFPSRFVLACIFIFPTSISSELQNDIFVLFLPEGKTSKNSQNRFDASIAAYL